MKHYDAPWSRTLIVMSALTTLLCLGVTAAVGLSLAAKHPPAVAGGVVFLPPAILLGAALFTIRGYSLEPDCILVHRLLWSTRLSQDGLQSAQADPEAMRGSIRTFGNGGAFSFTGYYYNKRLGSYRAYVTDPRRAVVLRYAKRRVVLSPASPEAFVRDLGMPSTTA